MFMSFDPQPRRQTIALPRSTGNLCCLFTTHLLVTTFRRASYSSLLVDCYDGLVDPRPGWGGTKASEFIFSSFAGFRLAGNVF